MYVYQFGKYILKTEVVFQLPSGLSDRLTELGYYLLNMYSFLTGLKARGETFKKIYKFQDCINFSWKLGGVACTKI